MQRLARRLNKNIEALKKEREKMAEETRNERVKAERLA